MTVNPHDLAPVATPPSRERLEAVIRGHVLNLLGPTGADQFVRVRHLWASNYRVNVFVGEATTFAQIAESFFVSADEEGNILTSTPAIRKRS